jgi:hypothetical protein
VTTRRSAWRSVSTTLRGTVARQVRGSTGKRPPGGGGGVRRSRRHDTRTSAKAKAQRVLPSRRWSLASAPATGEKKEA